MTGIELLALFGGICLLLIFVVAVSWAVGLLRVEHGTEDIDDDDL